jgi:hypothetical protein
LFRTSQLCVKLGTMRPPTSMMRPIAAANAETDAVVSAAAFDRFEMEHDIADNQHAEHDEDTEIAPILAGDDLAQRHRRERSEEDDVDHGGEPSAPDRRTSHRYAARQPKHAEAGQRIAVDRQPPGPIRNCGQQEAGGNRRPRLDHGD